MYAFVAVGVGRCSIMKTTDCTVRATQVEQELQSLRLSSEKGSNFLLQISGLILLLRSSIMSDFMVKGDIDLTVTNAFLANILHGTVGGKVFGC